MAAKYYMQKFNTGYSMKADKTLEVRVDGQRRDLPIGRIPPSITALPCKNQQNASLLFVSCPPLLDQKDVVLPAKSAEDPDYLERWL